jgi:hypothetical protein
MHFFSLFRPIWTAALFSLAVLFIPVSSQAQTNHGFTVTLSSDWYLQAGEVLNQSDPGIYINGFTYSTGPFRVGGAVFEHYLATGVELQPLPGYPNYYGTHQWEINPLQTGDRFYFQGLDLDNFLPGMIPDGMTIDDVGGTMSGAYVEVQFSDGFYKRMNLAGTPWSETQILEFSESPSPVPEPAEAMLFLLGLTTLGIHHRRQKR